MSDRLSEYLEYMSKYISWNVMVGIARSKVIDFDLGLDAPRKIPHWIVPIDCSTCSTSRSAEVRRQVSTMDAGCFCVACAALGAPQARFACQAQHLQHPQVGGSRLLLRGRRRTWSTSGSFCVAGAALAAPPQSSAEVRRQVSTMDAGCFCVAGASYWMAGVFEITAMKQNVTGTQTWEPTWQWNLWPWSVLIPCRKAASDWSQVLL